MSISILLLTAGALIFASAGVQHFHTVTSRGVGFVLTDRSAPLSREGFAGRAARTVQNNLESLGMILPASVVLLIHGADNGLLTSAALTYSAVRVGFTLSYWAGVSQLRSIFWGVGMAMIAFLTVQAAFALIS